MAGRLPDVKGQRLVDVCRNLQQLRILITSTNRRGAINPRWERNLDPSIAKVGSVNPPQDQCAVVPLCGTTRQSMKETVPSDVLDCGTVPGSATGACR